MTAGPWPTYLLLLAGSVLLASGGLKLADRAAFARAVEGFAVLPPSIKKLATLVLPVVELLLGLLLLTASGLAWRFAAVAATALMAAFTGLVALTLARGERPSCRCFGAVSAAPISPGTLLRNVGLTVLTAVVAWGYGRPDGGSGGVVAAVRDTTDDARSQLGVLVLFTVAVVVLWIRQDRLQASVLGADLSSTGVPVGPPSLASTPIPALHLTSPDGARTQLHELAERKAQLLVYISPTCSTCHQLVPLVVDWQAMLGAEIDVRLVSIGSRKETAKVFPHQVDLIWFDTDQGYGDLGIPGTPSAVLLGNNGTIGAGPAAGLPAIQELLGTIVQALGVNLMSGAAHQQSHDDAHDERTRQEQAGWVPEPGKALPDLSVVREDGTVARYAEALDALAAEAGVDTLTTIAWRHDCGYCEEILDDVRRASASGTVVLVTSESAATVRAQGLRGPVLQVLPPASAVEAVGVPGTPAAVPVRDGVVAGLGGIGGPHVLEVLAEFAGHKVDA